MAAHNGGGWMSSSGRRGKEEVNEAGIRVQIDLLTFYAKPDEFPIVGLIGRPRLGGVLGFHGVG